MLLNAHGLSSLFKIGRKILFNMGGFEGGGGGISGVVELLNDSCYFVLLGYLSLL